MARFTPTLGEITGSIGNLTFQKNFSGQIIRLRPRTGKSSTGKQYASHQALQTSIYGWQNLSLDLKDDWNTFAAAHTKFTPRGAEKKLSGFNWYTSINQNLFLIDEPILNAPPAYVLPPALPEIELLPTATQLLLNTSWTSADSGCTLLIFAYMPTNRVKGTMLSIKKLLGHVAFSDTSLTDLTYRWQTATGLNWNPLTSFPSTNIFLSFQLIKKSNGLSSPQTMLTISIKDFFKMTTPYYYY